MQKKLRTNHHIAQFKGYVGINSSSHWRRMIMQWASVSYRDQLLPGLLLQQQNQTRYVPVPNFMFHLLHVRQLALMIMMIILGCVSRSRRQGAPCVTSSSSPQLPTPATSHPLSIHHLLLISGLGSLMGIRFRMNKDVYQRLVKPHRLLACAGPWPPASQCTD